MYDVINKYETIFILDATKSDEELAALTEKFKTLIGTNGELEEVNLWGKRRLAYLINDQAEGYYVLIRFSSVPEFPKELDRIYKITDGVVRTLIVRREELDVQAEKRAALAQAKAEKTAVIAEKTAAPVAVAEVVEVPAVEVETVPEPTIEAAAEEAVAVVEAEENVE
jgi:small subunit ribosomal protein S6